MDHAKLSSSRTPLEADVSIIDAGLSKTTPPGLTPFINVEQMLDQTCVNVETRRVPRTPATTPKRLGRYEIIEKLGEGGMGAVFRARDTESGVDVALKVLSDGCLAQSNALRRFEKEARLLEEAKSPHVVNLIDVGVEGDVRYLVMEYVRGGDLRHWMDKAGVLDETSALEIIGELCQALVSAHARGMIHRDIKPENVLLSDGDSTQRPVVKLTDFGLARHIDQSDSMKLTQTGALLGTPYYMSPEQFTGAYEVSPATDVYAIGVTFFELLAGRRLFVANDPIQLAAAHCFEPPPDVRKLNSEISDATADLLRRMLAKLPGQRPPDASAVLEEILRLQNGESLQFVVHPVLPPHDASTIVCANYEFNLASSANELWPYVSNTDRFNQAAGLQPVTYESSTDANGRIRKFGQFKLGAISIRWEEHPFEWVEGQRFSVLREFPSGPFVWFVNSVELIPNPGGGCLLKHQAKIQPRGFMGRLFANLELGPKGHRKVGRIYQRIDNSLQGRFSSIRAADSFEETAALKRIQRQRLEQRLAALQAKNVSIEIVDAIRDLVLNASAQDAARLRPFAIAERFGLSNQDVVDAFLHAVPLGLLTLRWDIICPTCRLAAGGKSTLREIEQHANCEACQSRFKIEFGSSLELIFRVHPEIRSTDSKTYCAGGPGNFPHVVAQVRLEPGERLLLPLSLDSGSYIARGPTLPYAVPISVDSETGLRHGKVRCVPGTNRSPVAILRSGHQSLSVENFFPDEQLIRIERTTKRTQALTAAQAAALPLFRELFPEQTLSPGMLVEIETGNFLAIQFVGLQQTFDELGDAGTYSLLQNFSRIVERQIHHHGGSVVDRPVGAILAQFSDPAVAIQTAQGLTAALGADQPGRRWQICGALHRGPVLVTSDRSDIKYFGATINRTVQLAREANGGQLLLTPEVWSDPGVAAACSLTLGLGGIESFDTGEMIRQIALS